MDGRCYTCSEMDDFVFFKALMKFDLLTLIWFVAVDEAIDSFSAYNEACRTRPAKSAPV